MTERFNIAVGLDYDPALGADLAKALAALGNTPDEIANTLRDKEHKGPRGAASRCPVARYLRFLFPGRWVDVWAETSAIRMSAANDSPLSAAVSWRRGDPLQQFIDTFDETEEYADLVGPWDLETEATNG